METTADGQPAGTHTLEISSGAVPPARPALGPGEVYKQTLLAVGTVEALGAANEPMAQRPAVALDADHVLAAFGTIDGAASVRVHGAAGRTGEARELAGWTYDIAPLPPAVYRVDLPLDGEPVWRRYLKITE